MNLRLLCRLSVCAAFLCSANLFAAPRVATSSNAATAPSKRKRKRRVVRKTAVQSTTQAAVIHTETASLRSTRSRRTRSLIASGPWTEPTYADSTVGDNIDGEDLVVRKAAVDALGPYNGTVVVADPQTGRILSIVNQKLATKGAYQPCSTVKVFISLASLSEGLVNSATPVRLGRRSSMDLTQALARSNNLYFAKMGEQLGFDRVEKYGKLYGLGEKAGLDITGEEPGTIAPEPPKTGVGMMTSFGDGIRLTPLELTSMVSAIANGGTMYYLQYPKNQEEVQKFIPRIKRTLDIESWIPQIKPGMMGAVEYGTARRANYNVNEPIFGKTGTCTDTVQPGVHLGWFGSFNDVGKNRLAVIVLLTGGRGISGPIASGVAGNVYKNLSEQHYFGSGSVPTSLVSMQTFR